MEPSFSRILSWVGKKQKTKNKETNNKKTNSPKQQAPHMTQRPSTGYCCSSPASAEDRQTPCWTGGFPRGEQEVDRVQYEYSIHCTVLMVVSKSLWLCKAIRAGSEQGESFEEYIKLDPSSGRLRTNVGTIAQTWDKPEDTEQCLWDLLWKVDFLLFIEL